MKKSREEDRAASQREERKRIKLWPGGRVRMCEKRGRGEVEVEEVCVSVRSFPLHN